MQKLLLIKGEEIMANPIFLDLATQKGGAIQDPGQTKKNYKNQLLCQSFEMETDMAISHHKAHASGVSRPDAIKFVTTIGCHVPEVLQANLTGDRVTTATFSFPVTDKSGEETLSMTVSGTNGIIKKVKFFSNPLWKEEHDAESAMVEIEIAYEKLEVQDKIHNKQMSYSWDDR